MTAPQRGSDTRGRLLAAATQLVGEVGWHNVSTRLVAERAGVNQALVHYHFGSVSALLIGATTVAANALLTEVAGELAKQPTAAGGVDLLLNEIAGYTVEDPSALLLLEAFLASTRLPTLREELAGALAGFRAAVADWLTRIGHPEHAEAAAAALSAALDGIVLHSMIDPGFEVRGQAGPLLRMVTGGGRPTIH